MKILQVITSLRIGGAEKLVVDMVPLYKERGYQVDVLLFDGTETPFKKQLQKKGGTIYELAKGGSVYNPMFILKLIPFLKQYDIVHTHNTACQYYVAIAKLLFFIKVRLVTTEHSTNNRRRNLPFFRYIDQFIYCRYNAVVAISEEIASALRIYLNKRDIYIVSNGVNLSAFIEAQPLDRKGMTPLCSSVVITMVARFGEAKDQATLIRALALLPFNYCLFLVGGGDDSILQDCVCLSEKLNLTRRVVFAGIRTDIAQILKASDVVVMSSHWEGLSLSSIEGMTAGKPFVASDVNGLHEITKGAGVLFPHQDEKALAAIILELMNDKVYYHQVVKRCMLRASLYDIQKTIDGYLNVYKQITYV